jgi:hypothetical protein
VLLVVLFAAGFVCAFLGAVLMRRRRSRVLLAAAGVALLGAYTVYVGWFASCPAHGECDKWLGVVFLGAVAAGWVIGAGASWAVRRPRP